MKKGFWKKNFTYFFLPCCPVLNPQIIGVPPNCGAVARNESPLQSPTAEAEKN